MVKPKIQSRPVEFIYSVSTIEDTNRKVIAGLALLGISGIFLALSAFFLSKALSIIDYVNDDIYRGAIGCDSCQGAREALLLNSLVFGIIGAILGSVSAWFVITGHRETEKKTGIVK